MLRQHAKKESGCICFRLSTPILDGVSTGKTKGQLCVVFGARVLCYFSNSVHKKPARFLRPSAKGQGLHGTLRPSQPWNLAGKPWGGPLMVSLVLDPPWLLGSVCGFLLKSTKRGYPPKTNTCLQGLVSLSQCPGCLPEKETKPMLSCPPGCIGLGRVRRSSQGSRLDKLSLPSRVVWSRTAFEVLGFPMDPLQEPTGSKPPDSGAHGASPVMRALPFRTKRLNIRVPAVFFWLCLKPQVGTNKKKRGRLPGEAKAGPTV